MLTFSIDTYITIASPDQQDILTFPLEEFTAEFTANHIWDFISKGL